MASSTPKFKIDCSDLFALADAIHLERALHDLIAAQKGNKIVIFGPSEGTGWAVSNMGHTGRGDSLLEAVRNALTAPQACLI